MWREAEQGRSWGDNGDGRGDRWGAGWGLFSPAFRSRGLCAPPADKQSRWHRWARPPACPPRPRPRPASGGCGPTPEPQRPPLALTCTAAAPRSRRGTAPGWRGTWRTGLWRWRRWWPPQRKAVCRAGGQAGLRGQGGGHLWEPGPRAALQPPLSPTLCSSPTRGSSSFPRLSKPQTAAQRSCRSLPPTLLQPQGPPHCPS